MGAETRRAVFLDRDGTLNVEKDYLHRWEDWEWIPGAMEALRGLQDAGFLLVVVSNQSGVARGYYTADDVRRLHERVRTDAARHGVRLEHFYFCPHGPDDGCDCRKPAPGLLRQAAAELGVDLGRSYMIGDKTTDVSVAHAAGVSPILVRTGYGMVESSSVPVGTPIFDDIRQAFRYLSDGKSLQNEQ